MAQPPEYLAARANYRQLREYRPNVALLPWGACEAHNYHLPHGTDIVEAARVAEEAARLAHEQGARPIVLPPIPYGNNAQQLDQVATIHLSTATAQALLRDVAESLARQSIRRLVIVNSHGGNEFKPMIRDLQLELGLLIVRVNFWQLEPEAMGEIFDEPGDHAGDLETSLLMHLTPDDVVMDQAGPGEHIPFALETLRRAGVWTPRAWSQSHPDTGSGDPRAATADKGRRHFELVTGTLAKMLIELSNATPEQLPGGLGG